MQTATSRANDTVLDFARHYGTFFPLAHARHPQEKAKVESAVQVLERWILARLRHQRFASVHEVNQAIAPLLERLNQRPFQKPPSSRASAFAQLDAPALQALLAQCYELATFKTVRVQNDYNAEIERHRYIVRHALVDQVLEARLTYTILELLHQGQRVVSRPYNERRGDFTTTAAHLPAAHRAHMKWTPQRLIN